LLIAGLSGPAARSALLQSRPLAGPLDSGSKGSGMGDLLEKPRKDQQTRRVLAPMGPALLGCDCWQCSVPRSLNTGPRPAAADRFELANQIACLSKNSPATGLAGGSAPAATAARPTA